MRCDEPQYSWLSSGVVVGVAVQRESPVSWRPVSTELLVKSDKSKLFNLPNKPSKGISSLSRKGDTGAGLNWNEVRMCVTTLVFCTNTTRTSVTRLVTPDTSTKS